MFEELISNLWAGIYDRKLTDIFAVESEMQKSIAEKLQPKLTAPELTAIAKSPTPNQEAYELYLKGRFFWNKRTGANLRRAIEYFNESARPRRLRRNRPKVPYPCLVPAGSVEMPSLPSSGKPCSRR